LLARNHKSKGDKVKEQELLSWFEQSARPFLERVAKDRLAALENDFARLNRLMTESDKVTVCFLGNSGIGKSTLLNALAAGASQILPAGGIGPLTAQATEVHYSPVPSFEVTYHPRKHLWQVAFAIESRLTHQEKAAKKGKQAKVEDEQVSDLQVGLDEEARNEALLAAQHEVPADSDAPNHDPLDANIKQAKQIITGNQFSDKPLHYLVDALRLACDIKPRWHSAIDPDDLKRIERIKQILKLAKEDRTHSRKQEDNKNAFMEEMKDHAAGFLSPLIERIKVGWPSKLLESGVVLVDLPGVGIAQDSYRDITKHYVREKARAVILVVDRAGPTESTVELLRSSGYWDRLVGAADDPESDPCSMLITVTKVDDVASEEWRNLPDNNDAPKPKKREIFARLIEEFKPRMRSQITDQLGKIGPSDNEAVQTAREQARKSILDSLEIHPVSAPELRKLLLDNEEDRAFLQNEAQTGLPLLQDSLINLAVKERENRHARIHDVFERLSTSLVNELLIVEGQWRERDRAAEEAEKLADALDEILTPKRKEYDRRVGAFREFLDETVQAKIEGLVTEARSVAETEVNSYLWSLQGAHWATLRAAVRRGGCFYGSRAINLPDDIANYFQEPMAAVWGQKLLKDIRKRTSEFSVDVSTMVEEICVWANENGGAHVNAKLLDNQKTRISTQAAQMKQVGKEAVDELREIVKAKLTDVIRKPIKISCEKFVQDGDDIGPGVKNRVMELFRKLANQATLSAQKPAIGILQSNFVEVRVEIHSAFEQWGDPVQETADLIVERHEERVKRSDAQKRNRILAELDEVIGKCPISPANVVAETV
jgi:GTP-binding protein EngB required for normal cell division